MKIFNKFRPVIGESLVGKSLDGELLDGNAITPKEVATFSATGKLAVQDPYIQEITNEVAGLVSLCMKKRKDYTTDDNPFENFELSASFTGIKTWQSIFARLSEKFIRLSNLLTAAKEPENESVEDSLRDMALLSIILLVYRNRQAREDKSDNGPFIGG